MNWTWSALSLGVRVRGVLVPAGERRVERGSRPPRSGAIARLIVIVARSRSSSRERRDRTSIPGCFPSAREAGESGDPAPFGELEGEGADLDPVDPLTLKSRAR